MKPYHQLTLQGKARRLRQMAIRALDHYHLEVVKVSLITNEQNGIFRVDTADKQKYILRVITPDAGHSLGEINSEMMFLHALHDQSDINAPLPLRNQSGKWVTTIEVDGIPQPRSCAVFTWVKGKEIADYRTPKTWRLFGKLSAQLHEFARTFTPSDDFQLPIYDTIFPFAEDNVMFTDENRRYFTIEQFDLLQEALEKVQADIDQLYQVKADIQVIHGDLHHWNVLIAGNQLSPIDFEDLMWAHPIQDIATTLYYNRWDDNYDDLLAAFKQGYETITAFPEAYDGQLEVQMLSRRLGLLNYVFAAEEEDIAEFPNFIPLTMQRIQYIKQTIWREN